MVTALEDRYKELERMLSGGGSPRRSVLEDLVKDSRHGQDILHRNVQKAADLVRDFKQVAIDQTTDQRRAFDLAQVIEDVLVMVEPRFKHALRHQNQSWRLACTWTVSRACSVRS